MATKPDEPFLTRTWDYITDTQIWRSIFRHGAPSTNRNRALAVMRESKVYRDCECAFTQGTGLPLRLQGPEVLNLVRQKQAGESILRPQG